MKHLFYSILFLFICSFNINAQDCEIIDPYKFQILPNPDSVGIWDEACVNELYEKTFQVVVSDSLYVSGFGLNIDSVAIGDVRWDGNSIPYTTSTVGAFPDQTVGYLSISHTPQQQGIDSIEIEITMYFDSGVLPNIVIYMPDPAIQNGAYSVQVKAQGTCNPKPASNDLCFIASETNPCDSTSIGFFSSAFGQGLSYNWSFPGGQPSTSTAQNPTVYYPTVGTYDVSLTVDDNGTQSNASYTDYIEVKNDPTCYTVASYFNTTTSNVCDSSYITFNNQSTGRNPSYYWEFPGGVPSTSTDLTPYVYYENPGNYDVTLIVYNGVVADTLTRSDYITVFSDTDPECATGGYQCIDYGVIDLDTDCSWDSGPVCGCNGVEYSSSCIALYCFGVTAWEEGACGSDNGNGGGGTPSDTTCNLNVSFTYTGELEPVPSFDFVSNVTGGDGFYVYAWDFGDGGTSNDINATHTFALIDSLVAYTVCLEVYDLSGCYATTCETVVIDGSPGGTIGGTVVDGTNLKDGEPYIEQKNGSGDPIPNVRVDLIDVNGTVRATAFTDGQGLYAFNELLFGNYWVKLVIPNIAHEPTPVKLVPTRQRATAFGFEVNETEVTPTGVLDIPSLVNVRLFPNPSAGATELEMTFSKASSVNVSVSNVLGQNIFNQQKEFAIGQQRMILPSDKWTPGIYLVSLQAGRSVFSMKLLVK